MKNERLVKLEGASNFRDLGGYQNKEGKTVKWHKIYRSDSLADLTKRDLEKLSALNIVEDLDLRSNYEQTIAPDRVWKNVKKLMFIFMKKEMRKFLRK
ncbi:tyrosine-protein phosphatase [Lactobacillus sp. PV012]|uniref:tyrosine-protein phosphatase n=1 Tax=Lactobacillus sp. PV012 TaxID=2594494 RepID=UPI00223F6342|nr:tyrosine-protein phosphatase [Lactobacillus sp. PV012]QNQ82835.1 tyrosine-protein phosphatase [Lactobacillus sp. PV012]